MRGQSYWMWTNERQAWLYLSWRLSCPSLSSSPAAALSRLESVVEEVEAEYRLVRAVEEMEVELELTSSHLQAPLLPC